MRLLPTVADATAASSPGTVIVVALFFVSSAIWVGGLVVLPVVASTATRTLPPESRVDFFRALGPRHGAVSGASLLVAIATGIALLVSRGWDGWATTAVVLAAAIAAVTGVGVAQARAMSRQRRRGLEAPGDAALAASIDAGARRATLLRTAIGVLTLALCVLGAWLAVG